MRDWRFSALGVIDSTSLWVWVCFLNYISFSGTSKHLAREVAFCPAFQILDSNALLVYSAWVFPFRGWSLLRVFIGIL